MINFSRSSFTWQAHPWKPDPYYKWPGGFVGEHGQVYHVRFTLEARCVLRDSGGAELAELFFGRALPQRIHHCQRKPVPDPQR